MQRSLRTLLLGLLSACTCGCGAQAILLDTQSEYLFTTFDALALPGEQVRLRARLQAGDLLQPKAGLVVRFLRDGRLYKAAETDRNGLATVSFVPSRPGLYRFSAALSPNGFPDEPPGPQPLLVRCCSREEPLAVVDLDKTLVASGFQEVLIGQPQPMPESARVMRELSRKYSIIYLTHRPDFFGPKSKAWLRKHNYPEGPLLLSSVEGFLSGSRAFKTRALRRLRRRFKGIRLGIGDKIADVRSYHDNGMRAFLLLHLPPSPTSEQISLLAEQLRTLPAEVQVVRDWNEIHRALEGVESYPPQRAWRALQALARDLQAREKAAADTAPARGAGGGP